MSNCVVFVCNYRYFLKFLHTCNKLISNGKYNGNICLVIGDDLKNSKISNNPFIKRHNITIKYFPDIVFSDEFIKINSNMKITDGRNIHKKFQWHKLHLFNTYFKQWDYVFYIDCGMTIFSDINPILESKKPNILIAHSDAYPTYVWKLSCQFDNSNPEYYAKLRNDYNLDIDYFQTGIMLYDTTIIDSNTFDNLYNLSLQFPISRTNEQGIISLYFTNIKPLWQQIPIKNETIYFYDSQKRNITNNYIMVKNIIG